MAQSFFVRHKILTVIAVILLLFSAAIIVMSIKLSIGPVGMWGPVSAKNGIAINGYDTVAYLESGRAEKGVAEFSTQWKGVTWYFASEGRKKSFDAEPEKYAPKFGGYCAKAVTTGLTIVSDPSVFEVRDGQVLLFFVEDAKKDWQKEYTPELLEKADEHWRAGESI